MTELPLRTKGYPVGTGWHGLVDLVRLRCKEENADIIQIKEKFGTLRIYVRNGSDELLAFLSAVETQSESTCENCGRRSTAQERSLGGWIKTLCKSCHDDSK